MPSSKKGSSKKDNVEIGRSYEELAARFFLDNGYIVLHRNYHAGHREIDLIVQESNCLVFVEVKSAESEVMGHPVERINNKKKTNLIKAAQQYVIENKVEDLDLRFDIVTFVKGKLEHYPAAFAIDED